MKRTSGFILIISIAILVLNISSPRPFKSVDVINKNASNNKREPFNIDYPSVNMEEIISVLYKDKVSDIEFEVVVAEIEQVIEDKKQDVEVAQEVRMQFEEEVNTPTRGDTIHRDSLQTAPSGSLNKYVLDVIKNFKIGNYPYLLNNDYENYNGVTENLYYKGELLLKAHPSDSKVSHCSGITFEVFFKAMQNRNKSLGIDKDNFNGLTKVELMDMALIWYVAMGPKSQSNLAVAVEKYDFGYSITNLEELKAGDFIDFSRENNTGHTAVFLNWIRDGKKIIGFKYWGSQGSTNGINYKEEYFNIVNANGVKYGNVIIDNLHMARISPK